MSVPRLSDASLVARCRAGDDTAWHALVDRYARYVHAIAVRAYGLRDHDAEDVFQEVFARAYEHLDGLRDPGALRPWLGQLARRIAIDRLRAARREEPVDGLPEHGVMDAAIAVLDEALTVRAALETLPDHCRQVLDRFFARDQDYRTIGAALGIPPGTIASRISRCLRKLRTLLDDEREKGLEPLTRRGRAAAV